MVGLRIKVPLSISYTRNRLEDQLHKKQVRRPGKKQERGTRAIAKLWITRINTNKVCREKNCKLCHYVGHTPQRLEKKKKNFENLI